MICCLQIKRYNKINEELIKTKELFNSHEWPRENFSPQYPYNFKQTSDENKEKYQQRDYQLIQ